VVIVDGCALRYGVSGEVKDFLEKTKFPAFVAPMGKSAVDESYERFGGVRPTPELPRVPLTLSCAGVHRKTQFIDR
jgi:pyruvate decarboxylase